MIPYSLLIILPAIMSWFSYFHPIRNKETRIWVIGCFFLIFALLLSLRHKSIGVDLGNYSYYFNVFSSMSWHDLSKSAIWVSFYEIEPAYVILNWIVGQFTTDFQWFLAVVAVISVVPVATLYMQDANYPYLKIILFMVAGLFPMFFSGLRQIIAISIGTIAYRFVRSKRFFSFLASVAIAFLFHRSAFILCALYPIHHVKIQKRHLFFIMPMIVGIFVYNKEVFAFLQRLLLDKYARSSVSDTGAYTMIIFYAIICVFSYVMPDERQMTAKLHGLRNILMLVMVLQLFAPIHTLAMRMNYYFVIFLPLLVPEILSITKRKARQIAYLSNCVMCVFFTLYYFISAHFMPDILRIYPYISFWKG